MTLSETECADGHVRVWSAEAIYHAGDPSYSKPKQLASMSYHSGTIHTVRFSPNGKYLASGADDKIVCVYTLDPNQPSHSATFGILKVRAARLPQTNACTQAPTNPRQWRIGASFVGS